MMQGFLWGILASTTFGLIPLFTLPLIHAGMAFDAILFYRFFIAALSVGLFLLLKREPFHVSRRELLALSFLSGLYTLAALFVFMGFLYLSSGITTTIHFLYPVFVTLIMIFCFKEKKSFTLFAAIFLACAGVGLLSWGGEAHGVSLTGIGIVLLSALCNALYIVGMYKGGLQKLSGLKITFYLLGFGAFFAFLFSVWQGTFCIVTNWQQILSLILLAEVTAVLSNFALIAAIKRIGSTLTSILGAMEPLTAVCVGALLFHEPLTLQVALGIVLILLSVLLIILARPLEACFIRWRHR